MCRRSRPVPTCKTSDRLHPDESIRLHEKVCDTDAFRLVFRATRTVAREREGRASTQYRYKEVSIRKYLVPGRVHRDAVSCTRCDHLLRVLSDGYLQSATFARGICPSDARDGIPTQQASGSEEPVTPSVQSDLEATGTSQTERVSLCERSLADEPKRTRYSDRTGTCEHRKRLSRILRRSVDQSARGIIHQSIPYE